jgi:hypothetical protein
MTFVYFKEFKKIGFEVLRAVVMKSSIFYDIMLCSPLKVEEVEETYRIHLQGQTKNMSHKKPERMRL